MLRRYALLAALLAPAAGGAQTPAYGFTSPTPRSPGHFGGAVAGIPDLNGDGRADLIVAANWEAGLTGQVHVYSGATGTLLRTLVSPTPVADIGQFGSAVAAVPDLDGDGVWDVAVGTSSEGSSATGYGRVHVFSGATGALVFTRISPNPEGAGEGFPSWGCSLAGLPDLDGDGRGDLLVGACREDTNDAGRAYVISGSAGALIRTLSSPNPETNGSFGSSVAGVPDADGDGVVDLLVAAASEDGGATNAGRVYLFSGATGALLRTLTSPNAGAGGLLGRAVAGVADLDGDGRGDLLVGAGGESAPGALAGRVYVFSGATGLLIRTLTTPAPVVSGRFGAAVAAVPDMDGDGRPEVAVGAQGENVGTVNAGRAYVFSGATGALLRSIASPNPRSSGSFGSAVGGVPDMDGDGRGDLLVGAVQENGTGTADGRAYAYTAGSLVAVEPAVTAPGLALSVAPNPAAGAATLTLELDAAQTATVAVYDLLGREVARLHDGLLAAGAHRLTIDAAALPPGVYLARVVTEGAVLTHRLTVVR